MECWSSVNQGVDGVSIVSCMTFRDHRRASQYLTDRITIEGRSRVSIDTWLQCCQYTWSQSFAVDSGKLLLRTVPTFISAHTFCASHKTWFKCHAHAGVDIDTINYATKYWRLKLEQNFPTVTKSSLMSLYKYFNQKHQKSSISLTTNC